MCFDVDSTVIEEEGIDMLAEFKGAGEAVAEWTKKYGYFFIYYVLQHYNCLCSPKYKHLTVEACTYHNRYFLSLSYSVLYKEQWVGKFYFRTP